MDLMGLSNRIVFSESITHVKSTSMQDPRELWRRVGSAADNHGCVPVERAAEQKFLGMCPVRPT